MIRLSILIIIYLIIIMMTWILNNINTVSANNIVVNGTSLSD